MIGFYLCVRCSGIIETDVKRLSLEQCSSVRYLLECFEVVCDFGPTVRLKLKPVKV